MEISIDEWIVHYISDPQKCGIAFNLLERVYNKCDKFVALQGGGLMAKIWSMSEDFGSWEQNSRGVAKYFFSYFLYNSDKFIQRISQTLCPLPEDLRQQTPNDDIYLVETAMNTQDKLILTTDGRLKEKLSGWQELNIQLVDEFLQKYDC